MTAIKKEELERLEREHGLEPDDLSYQHRCSRIAAILKGQDWVPPQKEARQASASPSPVPENVSVKSHPLYGKRILITPMIRPDGNRFLTYDEPLGPEMEVRDYNAGKAIYDQPKEVQRSVGDYEVLRVDSTKQVIGKASVPKVGTEISLCIGKDLVPVVHGNDRSQGYIWSIPTSIIQVEDTAIQIYGLKTLIRSVYPELEPKFSGKPMMSYVDGVTLAASIPMTHALLKEHRRKELMDVRVGLV